MPMNREFEMYLWNYIQETYSEENTIRFYLLLFENINIESSEIFIY